MMTGLGKMIAQVLETNKPEVGLSGLNMLTVSSTLFSVLPCGSYHWNSEIIAVKKEQGNPKQEWVDGDEQNLIYRFIVISDTEVKVTLGLNEHRDEILTMTYEIGDKGPITVQVTDTAHCVDL
jgi:hypothetical protein